jgi:hypothetical protein
VSTCLSHHSFTVAWLSTTHTSWPSPHILFHKDQLPQAFVQRLLARTVPNLGNSPGIQLSPPLGSHELLYRRRCNAVVSVVSGVTSYGVYCKTRAIEKGKAKKIAPKHVPASVPKHPAWQGTKSLCWNRSSIDVAAIQDEKEKVTFVSRFEDMRTSNKRTKTQSCRQTR